MTEHTDPTDAVDEQHAELYAELESADVFDQIRLTVDWLEDRIESEGDAPLIFGLVAISDAADGSKTRSISTHFNDDTLDDADFVTSLSAINSFNAQLNHLAFDLDDSNAGPDLGELLSSAIEDGDAVAMPMPGGVGMTEIDEDDADDIAFN